MIVAYIYDLNDTLVDQYFDIYNLVAEQSMNTYDTGSFDVYFQDGANKDIFKIMRRVKIYELLDNNTEKLYIDGYIAGRKPKPGKYSIILKGMEWILEKTYLQTNKTYNGTLESVIGDIIAHFNSRYNRGLTNACTEQTIYADTFTAGISIAEMLRKIGQAGYEYKIDNKVLYFGKNVGTDYTQSPLPPVYLNTQYINADSTGKRIDTADFIDNDKLLVKTGTITQSNGRILHTGATNSFLSATNIIACNAEKTFFFKKVKFNSVTVAQVIIGQPFLTYVLGSVALLANGKLQLEIPGTGSCRITTTMNFAINTEYDIVVKIKELNLAIARVVTDADIFVDGVKQTVSFSSTGTNANNPTGMQVGAYNSTTNLLNGSREEIRVYSNYFDDQTCIAICGGADVRDDLVARWNGKVYLQNFQSSAENLIHLYNINQRENYIYPTDGRVMSFDFALNADGTNSPSSQLLLRTPYMYFHARASDNQLQYRFDDSTSAVIAGATVPNIANLGTGDRKRHHIVLTFRREGGNTRMQGYLDGVYILDLSIANRNPFGMSLTDIVIGSGNVKVKGLQFYKFFDPVAGGYGIDEKDLNRIISRQEPVHTPSLFKFLGYEMNEGTGTVIYDNSGNGRNATIAGGASRETDTTAPFVVEVPQQSPDPVIMKYDERDTSDNNINDVEGLIDADEIVNAPYNPSYGFITDTDSINEYGRLEKNISGSGDIATQLNTVLEEQKDEILQADIKAKIDDYNKLQIGDKVYVFINYGDGQDNYSDTAKVIKKSYNNGQTEIYFSKNRIKSKTLLDIIKEHEQKLQNI